MKSYIYLIVFVLCFYYSICDEGKKINWLLIANKLRAKSRPTTKDSFELIYKSMSPFDLEEYRNLTVLKYWTRDDEFFSNGTIKNRNIRKKVTKPTKTKKMGFTNVATTRTFQLDHSERRLGHSFGNRITNNTNVNTTDEGAFVEKRKKGLNDPSAILRQRQKMPLQMTNIIDAYNIKRDIDEILGQFKGVSTSTQRLGRTIEYKDIVLIKATKQEKAFFRAKDENKYIDEKPEKKIIFIVHGLSVMGIKYLPCFRRNSHFKKLLSFYFNHLDKFDIYLIPIANPDGFTVVMNSGNRYWNKNVSPQDACQGVALDRNFDVAWNSTPPVSSCSQQYPGSYPFSEPESQAVRDIFHRYGHKIAAYINVHAGTYDRNTAKGDAVLYPRGFTDIPADDDKYIDLRGEIDEAMKNASFERIMVAVNTLHSWYGKIAGSSVDYASTVYGIPYALEFVMQVYNPVDDFPNSLSEEAREGDAALNEIWERVINTVFDNIYKTIQPVNEN